MTERISEEDLRIINAVEDKIFSSIKLGVKWSELDILDDVNAGRGTIQELGSKIALKNPEISATILAIAHSVYFDHSYGDRTPDFFDAMMHLGSNRLKSLLFSLALFSLGKSPDARQRAAKSTGIAILGKIIAEQMSLNDESVRKIETGGLLCQLGKNMFLKAREMGMDISDDIIQNHDRVLADIVVERLNLDPFMLKAVDMSAADFDEESFSIVGVIKLAEALTEDSFRRYGKLVVKSPMPDKNNVVLKTPGDTIKKVFAVLGVEDYVEVQEMPTRRQREAFKRHKKK
jgi:hypothetical protein